MAESPALQPPGIDLSPITVNWFLCTLGRRSVWGWDDVQSGYHVFYPYVDTELSTQLYCSIYIYIHCSYIYIYIYLYSVVIY